jgi:SAM-dependent methyltransferase
MDILSIINRDPNPEPWSEGDNIPWHEEGFSSRMLNEHLSQEHDAASRRLDIIEQHVTWIHQQLLFGKPSRILDLGCGPGLYANRLAKLGHFCLGIDYSPASIDYARAQASVDNLDCSFIRDDIRYVDYGLGYDLVMLIFGEFNVFGSVDASIIIKKAYQALVDGGVLLLEPHTFEAVRQLGLASATWYTAESGLFSENPHICLKESIWRVEEATATRRYYVLDAATGKMNRYAQSMKAYKDDQYRRVLHQHGYGEVEFYPSLRGVVDEASENLFAIVARKNETL